MIATALVLSGSRGGLFSLAVKLVALGLLAIASAPKRRGSRAKTALVGAAGGLALAVVVALGVVWVGADTVASSLADIPDDEWGYTFRTNVEAMFHLVKAAVPHMPPGSSIIGSSSVNSDMPSPTLAPYAATKAAIANFTASLAQLLGPKGIRVNSVAPGPIWTPLIPSTMPPEKVENFGSDTPLGRAGQPAELAPAYVLLASDDGSYISGARVPVTGGRPVL